MIRLLATLLALSAALACSSAGKKSGKTSPPARAPEPTRVDPSALARNAAVLRSRQIAKPNYSLWFRIDEGADEFDGRATLSFELRKKGRDLAALLAVDFEAGTLKKAALNGTTLTPIVDEHGTTPTTRSIAVASILNNGHQLYVNANELRVGPNRLELTFAHGYNPSAHGFHRFKDPADGETYVYTDFEPYFAHHLFPCFDQPDLKARFELTVEAPKHWQVIANMPEKETTGVDGLKSWTFPPSPPLSTYLFALHAGPFASWKAMAQPRRTTKEGGAPRKKVAGKTAKPDPADDGGAEDDDPAGSDGIPLRLFARKSIAKYVDFAEWLDVTSRGLAFYATLFDYPYPYGKYDQVILPEFASEAMENAGAVTVDEQYVFRSKPTMEERRQRAYLILHEMAHHWFGNLVTMKWWSGLWLNESFATLLGWWAVDQATDFKGAWQSFDTEKQLAYAADQLVTTHPIETHIPDTDHAFSSFDDITYGKGAAALRQLIFYIGEEEFRDGIQRYFSRYANRNTTIASFVKQLAEASGKDLRGWQQSWMQQPGVNTLRVDWACESVTVEGHDPKPRISRFVLVQGNAETSPILRVHKTRLALLAHAKAQPGEKELLEVSYGPGAETPVPSALGRPCPAFVFPNFGDYDYVKVDLDPVSLAFVREHLSELPDPLSRQMVWDWLWQLVVDGKLRAQDFAEIAYRHLPAENELGNVTQVMHRLIDPSGGTLSVVRILTAVAREEQWAKLENFTKTQVLNAKGGGDRQLTWFRGLLASAHSAETVGWLRRVLDGKVHLKGLTIDQERRWELLTALARAGAPDVEELLAKEQKKDATEMGRKAAIDADASRPDGNAKKMWLARLAAFLEKKPLIVTNSTPTPNPSTNPQAAAPVATEGTAPMVYTAIDLREAMLHFHQLGQDELGAEAADAYFTALPKLGGEKDEEFRSVFADSMYPAGCQQSLIDRAAQVLSANPDLPAPVIKSLRINRQLTERCLRAREKASGA